MDKFEKLPYLIGIGMGLISGIISFTMGSEMNTVYAKMTINMLVFLCVGFILKKFIIIFKNDIKKKEKEIELANKQKEFIKKRNLSKSSDNESTDFEDELDIEESDISDGN